MKKHLENIKEIALGTFVVVSGVIILYFCSLLS